MNLSMRYRVITIAFDLPMELDTYGEPLPETFDHEALEQSITAAVREEVQAMHPECLLRSVELSSIEGPKHEDGQIVFYSKGEVVLLAPESSPLFHGDRLALTA